MLMFFVIGLLLVGAANGNTLARIVNGNGVKLSDHPHQVSLQANGGHICGASIINEEWVITAAHCVDFSAYFTVLLNDGYLLTGDRERYDVVDIIKHERYGRPNEAGAYPHDIALIQLDRPIDFQQFNHKPITLADPDQDFATKKCVISGWGNTIGGVSSIPDQLQETDGVILTHGDCTATWGSNYNSFAHICIHRTDSGSCNGDSGGPMICDGVLAGVTSWGANGCLTQYPSVYARVSSYISWINGNIN